jgi:hypothetical protein
MGKGDVRDHAILLCSLLLGEGLDAYVCVGKKILINEELGREEKDTKDHWWVMIREPNSSLVRRFDRIFDVS